MIPVLYRDPSLLVCVKPAGVLSQPAPGEEESLLSLLGAQEDCVLYPVHRLDRGVGGVMVCAKTSRAAGVLSAAMARGAFEKRYLCIARGRPEEREGTWTDLLLHDKVRNKSFLVKRMRGGVKEASLDYRVLAEKDGLSLVLVRLHTGRTHQIRVQFAGRGMPLVGDGRYGGGVGEMALWSVFLSFPHPEGGPAAFRAIPEGAVWRTFFGELPGLEEEISFPLGRPDEKRGPAGRGGRKEG